MTEILFLSHRIPFPPDKGDKIRSYHLLRALAARHTVHLGTFIDDPADWAHVEAVQRLCGGQTCIRPLNPTTARLRSAVGLVLGEPLTMAYFRDAVLGRWIRDLSVQRPLSGLFIYSSSMGQYASRVSLGKGCARVLDICDVDSDKWRQYAVNHRFPRSVLYDREARLLAHSEARFVRQFDATLVISEAEGLILRGMAGDDAGCIRIVPNGVDTDYFDPAQVAASPFQEGVRPIVFTGAMDYHPNVDGVQWFVRDVWPGVRRRLPQAVFAIVGSNPSPAVRDLGMEPGVVVTGRVPDVRPYLAHASVVVAPLRIARGVQNKVLEAMAMARPLVATENALQGIPGAAEAGITIASDAAAMANAIVDRQRSAGGEPLGRSFVQQRYGWSTHLATVTSMFEHPLEPSHAYSGSRVAAA